MNSPIEKKEIKEERRRLRAEIRKKAEIKERAERELAKPEEDPGYDK